jgi:hypothetical protein
MLTRSLPARSSSEVEKLAGEKGWKLKTRTSSLRYALPARSSSEVDVDEVSSREVFERSREANG